MLTSQCEHEVYTFTSVPCPRVRPAPVCTCTLACRSGVTRRCRSFLAASFPCAFSDLYFRLPAPSPMLVPPFRADQTFNTVFNTTVIQRRDEPSGTTAIKVLVACCCSPFSASIRSPPPALPPATQLPTIPRFRLWLSLFPPFFPLPRVLGHRLCPRLPEACSFLT